MDHVLVKDKSSEKLVGGQNGTQIKLEAHESHYPIFSELGVECKRGFARFIVPNSIPEVLNVFSRHGYRVVCCASCGDPCSNNRGACAQLCELDNGRARCSCRKGFVLDEADKRACVDIDPCDENRGKCAQLCEAVNGRALYRCKKGFALGRDRPALLYLTTSGADANATVRFLSELRAEFTNASRSSSTESMYSALEEV